MPEPWGDWLGWAAMFAALLAFAYLVNAFLEWIDEKRRHR